MTRGELADAVKAAILTFLTMLAIYLFIRALLF